MYYAIKQNNHDLIKILHEHYKSVVGEYLTDELDVRNSI
jgi:hypothetical protein